MIKNDYAIHGLVFDDTFAKTDMILKMYRKVVWCNERNFEELDKMTYESCMGDTETLSYLLNFAPDKELDYFKSRAINAMQSRVFIDLINKAVVKMKDYPTNGNVYYSIIDMKYMDRFRFSEEEILEQLDLERSTFYRYKKEATILLGFILFGMVIPNYIVSEKVANL